jgi:hypothetical protein
VSKTENGTTETRQTAAEIVWRNVWYAHVMSEAGNTQQKSVREKEATCRDAPKVAVYN